MEKRLELSTTPHVIVTGCMDKQVRTVLTGSVHADAEYGLSADLTYTVREIANLSSEFCVVNCH
jgi:hypothetical protein